jgi:hypothetical protein
MIFDLKPGDSVRFTNFLGEGRVVRVEGGRIWVRDDLGIELELTWKDVVPVFKPEKELPDFRPPSPNKSMKTVPASSALPEQSEAFDWDSDPKPKIKKVKDKQNKILQKDSLSDNTSNSLPAEKVETGIPEIDIHLHEILEHDFGMDDYDKLQYQLNYLKKEIARLRAQHYTEIIIVHGVGKGRLREEVRTLLATYSDLVDMEDASFKRYGAGATHAFFRQRTA